MRCPQCNYNGEQVGGRCARCGFGRVQVAQVAQSAVNVPRQPLFNQPAAFENSPSGTTLRQNRYRLTKRVALPEHQKNQGSAWLAIDTSSHRQVVVREIPALPDVDARRIQLAATRLADLSKRHPGIPAVLDLFQEREHSYLVLEDREGNSLAVLMQYQKGGLPERMLVEYGQQLCALLAVLSSASPPIVHGSISPSTILISPDGAHVSLLHFPLFLPDELPASRPRGHPGYLAPEQVHGMTDPSSDLYSLAATLYHAVTGSSPADRVAFFYPSAHRLNAVVTPGMEAILTRGLQFTPTHRYPHPDAMQQDLRSLLVSYADPEVESVEAVAHGQLLELSPEEMREHYRSNSLLDAGVVASLVVLVLIILLFFIFR